ncbi:M35 family metallo-endopeptidase [Paraburkholderia susongensis]|uniref:Lysine-specific metallo-endopeptidase n=1 Tax=Paraburkholderia susongensis TaxID=1515439 RepID=A0A1X7LMH8_9BURK|nr:M35 family metallo-endopeptidase [Paraburkholderia susongensis]SMG55068.1 Lysine-specific metallo-endopeptidase [Paraburkholderia susongensis]
MNDSGEINEYGFQIKENEEWFEVHSGAVTNTNPGSMVYVTIDTTPICDNMSDQEFRKTVLMLRDDAVNAIKVRIQELSDWNAGEQERVKKWFGKSDENTRTKLKSGLAAVVAVMNGLAARNFVRVDSWRDKATGCVPGMKNLDGEVAHVCAPDAATRTIAINRNFCYLPGKSESKLSSMQLTIVHECTHFVDTFGSVDYPGGYGYTACTWLARDHPEHTITNADSIAWYVLARY